MMFLRIILLLLITGAFPEIYAQKVKTVSSTYTFYAPETMPVIEAKRIAEERAKIEAIANAFGTIVSQSNVTAISNTNENTDSRFFSFGSSDVRGEWIESIGEPVYGEIIYRDNLIVVQCSVKGRVRELSKSKIDIVAKPLKNGTEVRNESYDFRNGDEVYLYFKAPVDGFLSVFMIDVSSKMCYCVLPYRNSDGSPKAVKADTEYILFSKKHSDDRELARFVDEYVLTANDEVEYNEFYILFSPNPFSKAILEDATGVYPKMLSWDNFHKWLSNSRINDSHLTLKKIIVKIAN